MTTFVGTPLVIPAATGSAHAVQLQQLSAAIAAVGSGLVYPVVTVTGAYTMVSGDRIVIADSSSGFVVTLPSAVTAGTGKAYTVKNVNTGTVTMASTAGTVDAGAASLVTISQWAVRTFVSDGANWFLM